MAQLSDAFKQWLTTTSFGVISPAVKKRMTDFFFQMCVVAAMNVYYNQSESDFDKKYSDYKSQIEILHEFCELRDNLFKASRGDENALRYISTKTLDDDDDTVITPDYLDRRFAQWEQAHEAASKKFREGQFPEVLVALTQ